MQEELKTVKEIFGDYKEDSSINQCKIEKINLYKLGSTPDLNFSYNNATNILTISASDGNANTITYIGT